MSKSSLMEFFGLKSCRKQYPLEDKTEDYQESLNRVDQQMTTWPLVVQENKEINNYQHRIVKNKNLMALIFSFCIYRHEANATYKLLSHEHAV